jgi:transcriptional regulator with XRE-family HTH domain
MQADDSLAAWFGQRLRDLRVRAGLTQRQLADLLQLPAPRVCEWEHGRKVPSWPTVCRLADALGVSTDALHPHRKTRRITKDTA